MPGHVDALLLKRTAFRHEEEVRLVYVDSAREENKEKIKVPIDVNEIIDEIILDPRVTMGEHSRIQWIQERGFKNPIQKSQLYLGIILEIALYTKDELDTLKRNANAFSKTVFDKEGK